MDRVLEPIGYTLRMIYSPDRGFYWRRLGLKEGKEEWFLFQEKPDVVCEHMGYPMEEAQLGDSSVLLLPAPVPIPELSRYFEDLRKGVVPDKNVFSKGPQGLFEDNKSVTQYYLYHVFMADLSKSLNDIFSKLCSTCTVDFKEGHLCVYIGSTLHKVPIGSEVDGLNTVWRSLR